MIKLFTLSGISILTLFAIFMSIVQESKSYSCYYYAYYYWNSQWCSGTCWQNYDGESLSCSSTGRPYYHDGGRYRHDYSGYTYTTIYQNCHPYCASCTNSGINYCQTCQSGYYRWVGQDTCDYYCPRAGYSYSVGSYRPSSGRYCASCPTGCTWCADGNNYNTCYTCTAGYNLVDDQANQCNPRFGFDVADSGVACPTTKYCTTTCPLYYFAVSYYSAGNYGQTASFTRTDVVGSNIYPKRTSDVCVLCDARCRTCTNNINTACQSCTIGNFLWVITAWQTGQVCHYYCPRVGYSGYIGTYAPATGRLCASCPTGCTWCADGNNYNTCYTCTAGYNLVDDQANQCNPRFGFDVADSGVACPTTKYCTTTCPLYYFAVSYYSAASYGQTASFTRTDTAGSNIYPKRTSDVCVLCNVRCRTCTNNVNTACQSCTIGNFLWVITAWQTGQVCHYYCPRVGYSGYIGTYAPATGRLCASCPTGCTWCADGNNYNTCYTCTAGYNLVDDQANQCNPRFGFDVADSGVACPTTKYCTTTCPMHYFRVPYGSTPSYAQTTSYTRTDSSGVNIYPKRTSDVCVLCEYRCRTCTNNVHISCQSCTVGYYLWVQSPQNTICDYYCNTGNWTGYSGEYIVSTANRVCGLCDSNCKLCIGTSTTCYLCKDSAYLLDNKADCQARFPMGTSGLGSTTNCLKCGYYRTNFASQSCQSRDKLCRPTSCPIYFYFPAKRTNSPAGVRSLTTDQSSTNSFYFTYTQAASIDASLNGNPSQVWTYYRKSTNLCILCDKRCLRCYGPSNTNCTECVNGYFKYTSLDTCDTTCPIYQYADHFNTTAAFYDTQCKLCQYNCVWCSILASNCSVCRGSQTDFLASYNGFLFTYNNTYSTCLRDCPTSSTPNTTKGWYASIKTQTCYQCPGGCSNCNINTTRNDPYVVCSDDYCSQGIVCTDCLNGYSLVGGKCVDAQNCQIYAYFLAGNVSTQWTPDKCKCLRGNYMDSYVACYTLCDMNCKTCTGNYSYQCAQCEQGYTNLTTAGQCTVNQTVQTHYYPSGTGSNRFTISPTGSSSTCGPHTLIFGYQKNETGKYILYSSVGDVTVRNYYGISIKLRALFIDAWPKTGSLQLRIGSLTAQPSFVWAYNNYNAFGDQLCGTNDMDYLLTFYGQYLYTPTTNNIIFYITSNADLFVATNYYPNWGIKNIAVTVLNCHTVCATCSGPYTSDCITCSDPKRVVVNGTCTCNVNAGWFQTNGVCGSSCNANYYKDQYTAQCVVALSCSAPNSFASPTGFCVQNCPYYNLINYYAENSTHLCVSNCGAYGQYKYIGSAMSCQYVCPSNWISYAPTLTNDWQCVQKCPASWYYQLQNRLTAPKCSTTCLTGWQDDNLNECIMTCPNGYFRQTISTVQKCVRVCVNSYFGLVSTGNCVQYCPNPFYGDPTTWRCLTACPDTYFTQLRIVDGKRFCVTGCEAGQWGNKVQMNCSTLPMNCPNGTYANNQSNLCDPACTRVNQVGQNTTRMCQTQCTTGFANWITHTCVSICPADLGMFSYVSGSTRNCVTICDSANTGRTDLYGDVQANRSCVTKCASTPSPSFGQSSNHLCVFNCTTNGQFADPLSSLRLCVATCTSSPQTYSYTPNKTCLTTCPDDYFGDIYTTPSKGICNVGCTGAYWADPVVHLCMATCSSGYFGYNVLGRPCVKVCPIGFYGQNKTGNRVCVSQCDLGYWADQFTRLCTNVKTQCSNTTYADYAQRLCVNATACSTSTYADPFTKGCDPSCSNSSYFGDSFTHTCVTLCSSTPEQYSQQGYCIQPYSSVAPLKPGCLYGQYADYQDSRKCNINCSRLPLALFGNPVSKKCVVASKCPTNYYADNQTLLCINPCNLLLPFGDPISFTCVSNCPDNYYGDANLHLCVQFCTSLPAYYADNITGNCQSVCTAPNYGSNLTNPICQLQCPSGSFAKDGIRICVSDCGTGFFGDPTTWKCVNSPTLCADGYYGLIDKNLCVLPAGCIDIANVRYFAQNSTKTCVQKCLTPNYGDSSLWMCIPVCNSTYFGQNTTRLCLSGCSTYLSFAQQQLHVCVAGCSALPVGHFQNNVSYKCVEPLQCQTNTYAQNVTRSCVFYCPKLPVMTFADKLISRRCVLICPQTYYADDLTFGGGQCVPSCAGTYRFRQNSTKSCVDVCPLSQNTYGDTTTDMCVKTCPDGYFAQNDSNRRCVQTCALSWGNKITKICITNPILQCPPNTWADDNTRKCQAVCSSIPSTYGYNLTRKCVTSCLSPSFAYDGPRVCIDVCPASLLNSGYYGDPNYGDPNIPQRKCVPTCQANLYRDVITRLCQPSCTFNTSYKTYKDPTTRSCQAVCSVYPLVLYADSISQSCQASCSNNNTKKNPSTQQCVNTCPYLFQPNSNTCVSICPINSIISIPLYADLTLKKCVQSNDCPALTYASDDSMECVGTCPSGTFISGRLCVYICPIGQFIDRTPAKCVQINGCTSGTYSDYQTRSCVVACSNFRDRNAKTCVDVCPTSFYADPVTRFCQSSCSPGYYINTVTQSCVSDCSTGLFRNPSTNSCSSTCQYPYYADTTTKTCVSKCTSSPMTFASTSSGRVCVPACLTTQWSDMLTRQCVLSCTSSYSLSTNMSCVSFCPSPSYYSLENACVMNCSVNSKYSDDITRSCVGTCPTGYFKDDTTAKCVADCPNSYFNSVGLGACTRNCPEGTYSDDNTGTCVANCTVSPPTFAQETYNQCIEVCPAALSTFADYTTYKCVSPCPSGYYADNRTRTCKANCSNWYADDNKIPKACTTLCQPNTYADPTTFKCVSRCPTSFYSIQTNRLCSLQCPSGWFSDNSTNKCVQKCPILFPYADALTKSCVLVNCSNNQIAYLKTGTNQWGQCLYYCPVGYYQNPSTRRCVTGCPNGMYADTTNNTCRATCTQGLFRDDVNFKCVPDCPVLNALFANTFTMTCVRHCDPALNIYADSLTQTCEITCTGDQYKTVNALGKNVCVGKTGCLNSQYSDPYMKACVSKCYNNTFGYNGICYSTCPTTLLFANPLTQTCVTALNCPQNFMGLNNICVSSCPIASATFADHVLKICTPQCVNPYYADNSTRQCVMKCPDVPELFGRADRVCVQFCSPGTYADKVENVCATGCINQYFADSSTWKCVKMCPEGTFADNSTNQCVPTCPANKYYFGNPDPSIRQCVSDCPNGTFADPYNNRQCKTYCLSPLYAQNSTNKCLPNCLTGFSNPRSQQCIANCTTGYYGYNYICYIYQCPSTTTTVFADDTTGLCVTKCPDGWFGDISTRKCVQKCPISPQSYADKSTNLCSKPCTGSSFADISTRSCVSRCPQVPSLFNQTNSGSGTCVSICTFSRYADAPSRSCVPVTSCSPGLYADNSTYRCVSACPSKPMMYGSNVTNTCVFNCPAQFDRYADNFTGLCVIHCPSESNTFADPVSRRCVETCPSLYFASNDTRTCNQTCPDGSFADSLLRICVAICSIDPIFYGNAVTKICVPSCPSLISYGNPLNQRCAFDALGMSTCPDGYFGDDTTQLCVKKCPMKQNLYGDPLLKKCRSTCSDPTYIRDNSTMMCVTQCPKYPAYFADLTLKICVLYCPINRWASNLTRECVLSCPNNTFSQNSTWQCVSACSLSPLRFADLISWKCVIQCPSGFFSDLSTFKCVSKCPEGDLTFAQNDTNSCIKVCPSGSYAENTTRTCVAECWGKSFADNSSNVCVQKCPKYPSYYANNLIAKCVFNCPNGYFSQETNRTCVQQCPQVGFFRQNLTKKCVKTCPYQKNQFADKLTGYCVQRCSIGTYADPSTKICVIKCPNQPLLYADNSSQSCVPVCTGVTYGENTTRTCVNVCPENSLSFPQQNLCVWYCPIGYFADTRTNFCVSKCAQPYYGDPSTRNCVLDCPLTQLLFANNVTRQCVKNCSDGSYADKVSRYCVLKCPLAIAPAAQTYASDYGNKCVQECPLPTFAYITSLKCYNKCPNPYYNNLQNHKCQICPVVCTSCSIPTSCLSCIPSYYLQNGACVSQCSGSYYANPNLMTCITSTLCKPLYGVNSTNKCSSDCPGGQFKNINAYRCDACPSTCTSCTAFNYCTNCTLTAVASNNMCYQYCLNQTTMYYSADNKTCLNSCVNGTYLYVLFCKTCDPICLSCEGTSTNCTLCSNGLYVLNNVCVDTCPTGYRPIVGRTCHYCGDNCTQALTFGTNVTVVNGQTNLFMNFNSDVNISGNLNNTFKVVTTSRRLLGQTVPFEQTQYSQLHQQSQQIQESQSNIVNNIDEVTIIGQQHRSLQTSPPPYQIIMIPPKTVQFIFPPGYSYQNYQIEISNPQNIIDQYGNIPNNLRAAVAMDQSQLYGNANAVQGFYGYFEFLAIIAIIGVVFDFEFIKFLQLISVHAFVTMVLPQGFANVLIKLKMSTVDYVPAIYNLPQAVLRWTVPGKMFDLVGDYSFLRTAASSVTIFTVILAIYLIIKALSLPEINRFKTSRIWFKQIIDQKFTFGVFIDFLLIMGVNLIFSCLLQMRDYNTYDDFSIASMVISHIALFCSIITIGLITYKLITFFRQYPKLTQNLKKASSIILQSQQYNLLNSSNIFMFQKKKIDLRNLMYPKINNENILPFKSVYKFNMMALFAPVVMLLRVLLLGIVFNFVNGTVAQMAVVIPVNFLALLYYARARPYSFKFRKYKIKNYIAIYHQVCLLIFEILMLVLGVMQNNGATAKAKQQFSYKIIYYLTAVTAISFVYYLFRIYIQVYRKIWTPFIESELFKKNFPSKWKQYNIQKNKSKNFIKSMDPMAKKAIKQLITGVRNKSSLRPNQQSKLHPQLPIKHKITFFDRDSSSTTSSTLSKKQKKSMLKQLFTTDQPQQQLIENNQIYQEVNTTAVESQVQYEDYQEEYQVRVGDLSKYVANAQEMLRLVKKHQEDNQQ